MKLKIEPQERLDKVLKVSDALAVSTSDTDVGLCGM